MTQVILRIYEGALFKQVEHQGAVQWMLTSTTDTDLHKAFHSLLMLLNRGNSNHGKPNWPADGLYSYDEGVMSKLPNADGTVDVMLNE